MRRRPTVSSNEALAAVPVFTPDPHGAALFAGSLAGGLGGGRVVIDPRDSQAWHGPSQSPQSFRGAAGLGGRPVVPLGTTLDQERGAVAGDPVQEIFEQRAAARRFG